MENLKKIKEKLSSAVLSQLENGVEQVDTMEMKEAIDMIKDITEAMYHYSIVDAMEKQGAMPEEDPRYYTPRRSQAVMGEGNGTRGYYTHPSRMYYTENNGGGGRSGEVRRRYFESADPSQKMQSLEDYTKSLHEDINEMIAGASDNEKTMLKNKLQMIAQRL